MTAERMRRRKDWRARLSNAIESWRRRPFATDAHCGIFIADCIEAMTGVDLAAGYRGLELPDALRALQAAGHADLAAFAAAHLREIHPSRARAGDVMLFTAEGTGWAAGIVNSERVTVIGDQGLLTVSRDHAARAFEVPA